MTPINIPLKKTASPFEAEKYRIAFTAQGEQKVIWLSASAKTGWYLKGGLRGAGFIDWLLVDPLSGAIWAVSSLSNSTETLQVAVAYQIPQDLFAIATQVSKGRL
jgi:hypothetical protein